MDIKTHNAIALYLHFAWPDVRCPSKPCQVSPSTCLLLHVHHEPVKKIIVMNPLRPEQKWLPFRTVNAQYSYPWNEFENYYRKTPSISRISSISHTPTFEFWTGHQSPDYEILKTSRIGRTLTLATPTDSPAGQLAGVVNRPILTAHDEPATRGRQTSNRSMRPRTQWGGLH